MTHAAAKLSELQKLRIDAQAWCCNEILRRVLTDVANELRDIPLTARAKIGGNA